MKSRDMLGVLYGAPWRPPPRYLRDLGRAVLRVGGRLARESTGVVRRGHSRARAPRPALLEAGAQLEYCLKLALRAKGNYAPPASAAAGGHHARRTARATRASHSARYPPCGCGWVWRGDAALKKESRRRKSCAKQKAPIGALHRLGASPNKRAREAWLGSMDVHDQKISRICLRARISRVCSGVEKISRI